MKKKILNSHNLVRLYLEKKTENLNKPITSKKIASVIKNHPTKKSWGPDGFPGEFFQISKEESTPILLKCLQKIE